MNTLKSVYNRLFAEDKVELGKHEVELGMDEYNAFLNDAKKIISSTNNSIKTFKTSYDTYVAALRKSQEAAKELIKFDKELEAIGMQNRDQLEKDEAIVKQLGLDLKPLLEKYKEVNRTIGATRTEIVNNTRLVF